MLRDPGTPEGPDRVPGGTSGRPDRSGPSSAEDRRPPTPTGSDAGPDRRRAGGRSQKTKTTRGIDRQVSLRSSRGPSKVPVLSRCHTHLNGESRVSDLRSTVVPSTARRPRPLLGRTSERPPGPSRPPDVAVPTPGPEERPTVGPGESRGLPTAVEGEFPGRVEGWPLSYRSRGPRLPDHSSAPVGLLGGKLKLTPAACRSARSRGHLFKACGGSGRTSSPAKEDATRTLSVSGHLSATFRGVGKVVQDGWCRLVSGGSGSRIPVSG